MEKNSKKRETMTLMKSNRERKRNKTRKSKKNGVLEKREETKEKMTVGGIMSKK